ncbi:EF-hand domain-containing protein, partial [Klebsiella pneumoniae]|uniref:EF-hand domain-containing protein n=1 Tax=Klebsiella pneumoniae TaxID=573 RepID=UPI0027D3071D
GDGMLSPSEMITYLKANGYNQKQAEAFFDKVDTSKDKKISLQEFTDGKCVNIRRQALEALFTKADKDKSGHLSLKELEAAAKDVGLTDIKAVQAAFTKMDKDKSGHVDKGEFLNYMNQHY